MSCAYSETLAFIYSWKATKWEINDCIVIRKISVGWMILVLVLFLSHTSCEHSSCDTCAVSGYRIKAHRSPCSFNLLFLWQDRVDQATARSIVWDFFLKFCLGIYTCIWIKNDRSCRRAITPIHLSSCPFFTPPPCPLHTHTHKKRFLRQFFRMSPIKLWNRFMVLQVFSGQHLQYH